MTRVLQIFSIAMLTLGVSFAGDQKSPKDTPQPESHPPAAVKPAPSKGGVPKAGIPNGAARMVNPANIATRLFRMSPEEREHALEKLPTQQARDNARKTLEWFDSLPKDQQDFQLRRLEHFAQLTPEKRTEVRQLIMAANQLPGARRAAVGRELVLLQQMTDRQREATLHRPAFQQRFSPEELRIITGLADAWMGPL